MREKCITLRTFHGIIVLMLWGVYERNTKAQSRTAGDLHMADVRASLAESTHRKRAEGFGATEYCTFLHRTVLRIASAVQKLLHHNLRLLSQTQA